MQSWGSQTTKEQITQYQRWNNSIEKSIWFHARTIYIYHWNYFLRHFMENIEKSEKISTWFLLTKIMYDRVARADMWWVLEKESYNVLTRLRICIIMELYLVWEQVDVLQVSFSTTIILQQASRINIKSISFCTNCGRAHWIDSRWNTCMLFAGDII